VARWLELTGLARTLWRLRQPKPLSKAFGTRNTKYIASALDMLRSAGFVREAVAGDLRYVYLTERACGLLVPPKTLEAHNQHNIVILSA